MDNQDKDKKEYELAVLVKTEEDLAHVTALVRQHNGELSVEPRAKKLALAYIIKGYKEAVFAYCTFKAFADDAKNLEHDLVTKPEVIRSLIIASPPPTSERQPTPYAMQKRKARAMRPMASAAPEVKPAPKPLSNEALEKKIEEILK